MDTNWFFLIKGFIKSTAYMCVKNIYFVFPEIQNILKSKGSNKEQAYSKKKFNHIQLSEKSR